MQEQFQLVAVRYLGGAIAPYGLDGKPVGLKRVGVRCQCGNVWRAYADGDLHNLENGIQIKCPECDTVETVPYGKVPT